MKKSLSISVLSTINPAPLLQLAQSLAEKLELPFYPSISGVHSDPILAYTDEGLQLVQLSKSGAVQRLLFVDFIKGKNAYRHKNNLTIKQPLARAIGIKSGFRPAVFDATAGLGADSFVLACLGCVVLMCERAPVLHALLQDALSRTARLPVTKEIVDNRLHLLPGDSLRLLQKTNQTFHTIYLDPMYPHRTKSALNKLEMRVIRDLVGDDKDCGDLLDAALAAAENRVVVKRPKGAERIPGPPPSFTVPMKNSRFDVYL
ncbi:MAG: class I SAM-dependent methyltransferase [Deltaproteobacteria bacterium]|nr:class I SAM-dependent methyltransferase [Deltaproteobacteria bacterium]